MKYIAVIGILLWATVAYTQLNSEATVIYNEGHLGCLLDGKDCEGLDLASGGLY